MGLEADSQLTTDGTTVAVKALLESDALILRGGYRLAIPRGTIANPHTAGDQLAFEHAGRAFALTLPAGQAAKWLKKLTTAPPSLTAKLGVDATHPVMVRGEITDPALTQAFDGVVTTERSQATQGVIIALSPEDLSAGLADIGAALPDVPLWIIYPKGARSPLPESAVRSHMRALGYIDTKTSAVSQQLTALRFSPRKA